MTIQEFDWVKARANCSSQIVFEQLRLGASSDAKSRTDMLLRNNAPYGFVVASHGASFSVIIQGDIAESQSITFTRTEDGIAVRDANDAVLANATLTLNDTGDCRLKVDGKELDFWQFRKLVLEDFFFSIPVARSKR